MTSEIRANTLKNRVGLGTVSFTDTGPVVSGIVTATSIEVVGAINDDAARIKIPDGMNGAPYTGNLELGNSRDFVMLHDGHHNYVKSTQNMYVFCGGNNLVTLQTGGSVLLNRDLDVDGHTNLDNVSVAGVSTFSNDVNFTTANGNNLLLDNSDNSLKFGDNVKAKFGTGTGDLEIYHTGSGSVINDIGIGHLHLRVSGSNRINIQPDNVQLCHSGNSKLETTSTGITVTGTVAATSFTGALPISNESDDRVLTSLGSGAINAEANLRMTGNILTFNTTANSHRIENVATGNHYTELRFDSNRSGAGEALAFLNFRWDGDTVADIYAQTGSDTTNKDDGNLIFRTSPSQGSITERLRITSDGKVGLGRNDPAFALDIKSSGYSSLRLTNSSETGHGSHDVRIVGGGSNYQNIYFEASAFKFNTYNGSSVGERLRIASNGDVGVGNNNPDVNLHIGGGSEVTSPMVKLHRTNTYNNAWKFYQSHYASSDYGTLFIQPTLATTPNVEIVNSSGAMAMRVDSDTGVIKVKSGGGIEFSGGTPNSGSNPTVNSAILDDYEEGKFEPKFLENGTTESNYAWRYGSYVKVGGIVTVRLAFGLNGFQGNFTTGWIGGMPYTHASPWGNSDFAYIQLIGYSYASGYGDSANTTQLSLELSQNADKFRVVQGQGKGNINQSSIGSGQRIAVTFQYPVA
tara:strand:- start:59 stop:2125 length:2067 start_codon:yes stop_codon:yes gene_type:complete